MYILGISCFYHDSSAALLKNGKIIAAAAEERFTRKKHDISFPINAINYCLKSQNVSINDVKYISFYEKPLLKFERILSQHLEMFPKSYGSFISSLPFWINKKLRIIKIVKKKLKYKDDVLFIEHHLAHAASSFLASPFEESAILTVDGVGEWSTTTYGLGKGEDIHLMKEIKFPHSLGLFYSTITAYLGFRVNNSEYKVMGLSAYGQRNKEKNVYYNKLKKAIDFKKDGSYRLNMDYFVYHYGQKMPSKKLCRLLDGPIRKRNSIINQRHKDIAAALQIITEEVIIKMLKYLYGITGFDNIVLSGGVALNSVLNGKIIKKTPFKNFWIQPAAGDDGASVGAALYAYHSILRKKRNYHLVNAFLGPEYSTNQIRSFLDDNKIKYTDFLNKEELIKTTAKFIFQNYIISWFQGRMEWGPRALGSRSILANPLNPEMKNILNSKVKHRENFRPFAPAICQDDVSEYFECDNPVPEPTKYMLAVYPVKKKWRNKIPSVVHVDGSSRLQVVDKKQNSLYYHLIKEFGKLSGIPILINTSFNVQEEPIVCSPMDAYKCMMGTKIDYLIIDKFLIKRKDNL